MLQVKEVAGKNGKGARLAEQILFSVIYAQKNCELLKVDNIFLATRSDNECLKLHYAADFLVYIMRRP